jgi:hypothetical protein
MTSPLIAAILADPGVGVDFKAALGRAEEAKCLRRAEYVSALLKMDWQFEHADDHRVWEAGRAELVRLRDLRYFLDTDHALWKKHAPKEFHHG